MQSRTAISEAIIKHASKEPGANSIMRALIKEQIKNLVIMYGNDVWLSWEYIPTTQRHLDHTVLRAATFDYSMDFAAARAETSSIVEQSSTSVNNIKATTDVVLEGSKTLQDIGNIATLAGSVPGTQKLLVAAKVLKSISLAGYVTSAAMSGRKLVRLPNEVGTGMLAAFHPSLAKREPLFVAAPDYDSPAFSTSQMNKYQESFYDTSVKYLELLNEIISLLHPELRDEALVKLGELLKLDNTMTDELLLAQAPIFAAADQAIDAVEGFGDLLSALVDRTSQSLMERVALYVEILHIFGDSESGTSSLAARADTVAQSLESVLQVMNAATEKITGIPVPAFVFVLQHGPSSDEVMAGEPFQITATVKNVGPITADSILVSLKVDSSTVVLSDATVELGSLDPYFATQITWNLQPTDSTIIYGHYSVNISSSNAKVMPGSGLYRISNRPATSSWEESELQSDFYLAQNHPNPFRTSTTISFSLPQSQHVRIVVFDVMGRRIMDLVDRHVEIGTHAVTFEASSLPAGVYIYQITTGRRIQSKKMLVVR